MRQLVLALVFSTTVVLTPVGVAVVLGQEGAGLPQDIMPGIDLRIRIPMADTIDSLNVATAAAVILYEAMRQRLH